MTERMIPGLSHSRGTGLTWEQMKALDAERGPVMPQPCSVEDCQRPQSAKGYCRMHYRRLRSTGDPLRKSRFATQAEKDAFISADIAARRERRAAERELRDAEREVERHRRRVLADFDTRPTRPDAVALVEALDSLDENDRAAVASALGTALLGRPVDLTQPTATASAATTHEGATS